MKKDFSMPLESWNTALQVASVVLLALTFLVGAGAVYTGYIIGKRQEKRIAETERSTAEANKRVAEAREGTAKALVDVAAANERAKQMEVQAEDLRRQNLEIQRKISPRFLTTTEREIIVDAVRPFAGHSIIFTRLGDGEAGPYEDSFIAVFQKAGWAVHVNHVGIFMPPTYGIICRVSTHPDVAAVDVIAAFAKAKIELTAQHVEAAPGDSWIDMMVALKPVS